MPAHRDQIVRDIFDERRRQHEEFGDQSGLGHMFMLAVLMEEVGEVAREVHEAEHNRLSWESPVEVHPPGADVMAPSPSPWPAVLQSQFLARIRAELVQVAAVAVQIIEHVDAEER